MSLVYMLTFLSILILFTGCSNVKEPKDHKVKVSGETFIIEADESMEIITTPFGKYNITIKQNGDVKSQGYFILEEAYEQYMDKINNDENAELLDTGTKDGNEYIFWSYNNSEYNYSILIKDSSTALTLTNDVSEESAKEVFNELTIKYEE